VHIEPGDSFFAYTDGLTDTVDRRGAFFSEQQFIPLLCTGESLSSALQQIHERVSEYAGDNKQFDDIAMLALRRSSA
jgi:serine phosphatase RsbU (regulator of sigma subunit)